ncbi:hypothetical protein MNBD_GAMMA22-878 [hydrothermal vent metagenome]|uniref:Uncharacterized protein n=1 Tax=hydrothermal vent metagenome TaxID=652676 RepID=A0A3B1A4U3_9ZZZZ
MRVNKKRAIIMLLSLVITFVVLRLYLYISPSTNLDIASYNIHHLYTGLLLIALGGIPLILFHDDNLKLDIASVLFGVGLSMALDEWVYLIATDGSDKAYLLAVSFWGAVVMLGLTIAYILILMLTAKK